MDHLGRETLWAAAESTAWAEIDKAVQAEVARIRVAEMVFPTVQMANAANVPLDQFNPQTMTIDEGQTRPFVEISLAFAMAKSQVDNEATLRIGRTLSLLAAKTVAQCEDEVFFQGTQAPSFINNPFPGFLTFTNINSTGNGLLGLVNAAQVIDVNRPRAAAGYGSATFDAVAQGIAQLISVGQPGPFALFLHTAVYADTFQTVAANQTTTAERIVPLVTNGFHGTGSLPAATGLLLSLGGEPTTIYLAQDAVTAFTQEDPGGAYRFRVFERVQIVNRDPRALVRLNFQ
ncbi:MAG: encapsulin [Actinobacteria bacterium]|nr:encapsulin [Actinomycetota bacterium]